MARTERGCPPHRGLWSHRANPALKYPWQLVDGAHPDEKELKKRDTWQKLFMPQGAMLAGRVDTNHWLTFGCRQVLPVLAGPDEVLMAGAGVETAVRYGVFTRLPPTNQRPRPNR